MIDSDWQVCHFSFSCPVVSEQLAPKTEHCIGSNVFQVMAAVFEIAEFQFVNLNILQKFK
jgi:hypothetical protein